MKKQQKKEKKEKTEEKEDGDGEGEGEEDEDKVIFVHYEQRKVMLSQLHPIENGLRDPTAGPPSELRQVQQTLTLTSKRQQ